MLDCIVNVLTTQRQMRMKRVTNLPGYTYANNLDEQELCCWGEFITISVI